MATQQHTPRYRLSQSLPVPREPSAYRITEHFRFRVSRRTNPSVDGEIIRRCIEEGELKTTQQADRFIFEFEAGYTWRLIVALRDEAFLQDEEKHRAVTVYAVDGEHDEPEWSP